MHCMTGSVVFGPPHNPHLFAKCLIWLSASDPGAGISVSRTASARGMSPRHLTHLMDSMEPAFRADKPCMLYAGQRSMYGTVPSDGRLHIWSAYCLLIAFAAFLERNWQTGHVISFRVSMVPGSGNEGALHDADLLWRKDPAFRGQALW